MRFDWYVIIAQQLKTYFFSTSFHFVFFSFCLEATCFCSGLATTAIGMMAWWSDGVVFKDSYALMF